ncbi:MAG: hypothetical protein COV70_02105 [Parcubacteria group bacterium CG11_big_fil_rev_8_21_14_0_20_39_22]|nr:MAG: hypothetical protein COV70_02105 [Parcubacteria group bacterium CG11_big_fil_rev_8_21_14_0_20_39_22]
MEENPRTSKILESPEKFIEKHFSQSKDIIATWGFSPDKETMNIVKMIDRYGFDIFWFDGDRGLARKATMQRADFDESVLNKQMRSLDVWNVPEKIGAKIVNVFNKDGSFRNSESLAQEIGAF